MTISDYLTFSMTGKLVGDAGTAAFLGILDVRNLQWWDAALEILKIPPEMLSMPLLPGSIVGTLSKSGAQCFGLRNSATFFVGSLDHHVAAIGAFADLLDIVGIVERQQEQLRRRIIRICSDDRFRPSIELLQSIPGVGEIFSCVIFAEIGNFERFPNADTLEFWAGLTPDNKESAGRTQSGSITKAGSATLRWAVCCAAMNMCKNDQRQKTRKIKLRKRIGVKAKVNVAMGRRLLRIIFAMMRDGTIFEKRPIVKKKRTQHAAKVHTSTSVK